jgi:2-oxo-hept-3-ene-1,7-dioate hydratase
MTPQEHAQAATDLLEAEKAGTQISLLSLRHPEIGMDDAYAVQNAIYRAKIAQGRKVIGWKIGLTSKAMQSALNIDIPDSGILFDDMLFANGGVVPAGRFIQPRIEAEIAFVLKAPLSGADVTRDDVLAATDFVAPSIEILDTRIQRMDAKTGQTRKIFDTISDNAANAGVVLGPQRHAVDAFDLRWVGAITSRNGEVEETGLGAGVLFKVWFGWRNAWRNTANASSRGRLSFRVALSGLLNAPQVRKFMLILAPLVGSKFHFNNGLVP